MDRGDVSFFDRSADWDVVSRALPHWSQAGVVTFITWRLADSLPQSTLKQIEDEITSLLVKEGLDPSLDLRQQLANVSGRRRAVVHGNLFKVRDRFLDQGLGACHLALPECSGLVLQSLCRFDRERYLLTDAVVMPNHVHFLCAFSGSEAMLKQCTEWKRFTARRINSWVGSRGEFWQVDQFDHLVRSPEQFEDLRNYIAENPIKAGLQPGRFAHYQRRM